ncbi:alpha/beta fold hydrolase [Sneathiella sp.]|uniref:alpha/beta fold hydrolase n=1 Tax=Sneathiella sp. TaxID=1964365 RepID=UPI0039E368FF
MTYKNKLLPLEDFSLSYYEWGDPQNQTLLFIHATGMHGLVWEAVIQQLQSDYHIIAVDQRGHGRSQSDRYLLDWSVMGNDAINLIEKLDLNDIIGVGHSMGGHVMLQAALSAPRRFKRLVLIDPVVFPLERYDTLSDFEKGHPKDNPIARRKNDFSDWRDMYDIFRARVPYSDWQPEILENYCRYGVVPAKDNPSRVSLACPPDIEASVYMGHCSVNLHNVLSQLKCPVLVLRARGRRPDATHKIDFSASPTDENLAHAFENGRDVWLQHLSHFIPMEDPALTAEYIEGRR